jgi:hypothetical protein
MCHKVFQHRASSFTSPLKEVMLWIFIAHKIHCPQPSLNLQTLGPVASMTTTRPPRPNRNTWKSWCKVHINAVQFEPKFKYIYNYLKNSPVLDFMEICSVVLKLLHEGK